MIRVEEYEEEVIDSLRTYIRYHINDYLGEHFINRVRPAIDESVEKLREEIRDQFSDERIKQLEEKMEYCKKGMDAIYREICQKYQSIIDVSKLLKNEENETKIKQILALKEEMDKVDCNKIKQLQEMLWFIAELNDPSLRSNIQGVLDIFDNSDFMTVNEEELKQMNIDKIIALRKQMENEL